VRPVSKRALTNLITALESAVRKLDWKPSGTEWAEYYEGDSYTEASNEHKRRVVADALDALAPQEVWDLGANVGEFSRIAADRGIRTLAFDIDPACVERNYRRIRKHDETQVLPLLLDLANPSPALGWAHGERASLVERRSADVVMALALIHHLAISNNVPLASVAAFFASLAPGLIVEFVPKTDPKVRVLLATREDVFPDYTQAGFEAAFASHFTIEDATPLAESERTLYRMRRRERPSADPTSSA
jgi:ribosomal protein L11 methylase PrmA